jgi:hypothetical protein
VEVSASSWLRPLGVRGGNRVAVVMGIKPPDGWKPCEANGVVNLGAALVARGAKVAS